MTVGRIVALALAVYRLSVLIAWDGGPFGVFARLRSALGRLAQRGGAWYTLAELVHCPKCVSVWIAFAVSPLVFVSLPVWVDIVVVAMALSGLVYLMVDLGISDGRA